jgi:large subunit ribosomal protein L21
MFAVVRTGGKQYRVAQNDRIEVELLDAKEGANVDLDVLAFSSDGSKLATGKDSGAKVSAKVVSHIRNDKVVVFKKKRRKNYRRTAGHRQNKTVLEITGIKAA